MAINHATVLVPREDVFAVLADGWTYANWVVGTSHIRAVETNWPDVGTHLFHGAGAWPAMTRDETVVDAVSKDSRLELTAKGRPFGSAKVVLELFDQELDDDGLTIRGCRVTMTETPISGPGSWLHNPLAEALLLRRNTESLARLCAVAERRTSPRD